MLAQKDVDWIEVGKTVSGYSKHAMNLFEEVVEALECFCNSLNSREAIPIRERLSPKKKSLEYQRKIILSQSLPYKEIVPRARSQL
ncbi:MAG: hypothetical protein R3Y63_08920 [Eubacteriales bacterium]